MLDVSREQGETGMLTNFMTVAAVEMSKSTKRGLEREPPSLVCIKSCMWMGEQTGWGETRNLERDRGT